MGWFLKFVLLFVIDWMNTSPPLLSPLKKADFFYSTSLEGANYLQRLSALHMVITN